MSGPNSLEAKANSIGTWLSRHENELASFLSDLVAVPTENPPGIHHGACLKVLERWIKRCGLIPQRLSSQPEDDNAPAVLVATCPDESGHPGSFTRSEPDTLYFHGHYDVVPAQSREQFQPVRKSHFLFGRGACDMKGGIVSMLYAIRALRETATQLNGRIALTLVPDEETGGAKGSAWLAARGLLGRNSLGMLTAEPTSGVVWNANRGAISLRVQVKGKSAHVGLQHQGENAFERMHFVVRQLMELKKEVEHHMTRFKTGAAQARNSILMLGGQSGGGSNFNVVPDRCWFTIDRRLNPEEDLDDERARLLDCLERCKAEGIPLEWEILQEARSAASDEHAALGHALARCVLAVTGEAVAFEMCPGLLETRFYAAQGISAFGYGPGLLSVAHGPDEYVDLRKVIDCAAIYALTALEILGV
jgi:succinyl-diaminopimelate desuccinylase